MFRERNTDTDATTDTFQTLGTAMQSAIENLAARMSGENAIRAAWGLEAPSLSGSSEFSGADAVSVGRNSTTPAPPYARRSGERARNPLFGETYFFDETRTGVDISTALIANTASNIIAPIITREFTRRISSSEYPAKRSNIVSPLHAAFRKIDSRGDIRGV